MKDHTGSRTSNLYEGFLAIPRRERAARLTGTPVLPKPYSAKLDEDGYLTWGYPTGDSKGPPPKMQRVPDRLCFDFARLGDGSNKDIRCFAAKWGPLGLELKSEEHVNDFRRYARIAQALLRFSAQQLSGSAGADEDWSTICEYVAPGQDLTALRNYSYQMVIAHAVNKWFAGARGHAIMGIGNATLQVRPFATNLFGILITQIAHAIGRTDQAAVCDGCKAAFIRQRAPSKGPRQYCAPCRKAKLPQRDASRDWRRRTGRRKT